jgi:tryptophan 2,3-dioxygenase
MHDKRPTRAGQPAGSPIDSPEPVQVDVSDELVFWDLPAEQSYGGYLDLERLLGAQHPRSTEHDEMLFIIVHQTSELWMKLCLHELQAAITCIQRDDLAPCFKMLARIGHIQTQLVHSWDVLATLTPFDYSSFRNHLGRSSGFQSVQYRLLEFLIGNKNRDMIAVHGGEPAKYAELTRALEAPSLYDESLRLLSRRGFEIPDDHLDRDFAAPYVPHKQVTAAWLAVYHSVETHWDLYELAEKLMDLDHRFQLWRFAHMKTVERIIGYKRGTGGTSGVAYLAKALELRFFPELWSARTSM